MEMPFIAKLQAEVTYECGICQHIKLLKYVTLNDNGDTLSICEECRDTILKESTPDDRKCWEKGKTNG